MCLPPKSGKTYSGTADALFQNMFILEQERPDLGAFASNKVQGFALSKAVGVLLVPPLVAYFIDSPWQILFGLDPLYWPAKVLWLVAANSSAAWTYLLIGILVQLAVLRLLMRRMNR